MYPDVITYAGDETTVLNELSRLLEVSKETVSTYLDLLEKAFIIFRLNPLSST